MAASFSSLLAQAASGALSGANRRRCLVVRKPAIIPFSLANTVFCGLWIVTPPQKPLSRESDPAHMILPDPKSFAVRPRAVICRAAVRTDRLGLSAGHETPARNL